MKQTTSGRSQNLSQNPQEHLLAVDVGLRTGLALFADNGRLLWYRSHHLPSGSSLKRFILHVLDTPPRPTRLILEGSGSLADSWIRAAERRKLPLRQIQAEEWRKTFLLPRQQHNAQLAKQNAIKIASRIIANLSDRQPTALRHDTAEAVLVGTFGLLELGWLEKLPES